MVRSSDLEHTSNKLKIKVVIKVINYSSEYIVAGKIAI